jgi:hypothetical protein
MMNNREKNFTVFLMKIINCLLNKYLNIILFDFRGLGVGELELDFGVICRKIRSKCLESN